MKVNKIKNKTIQDENREQDHVKIEDNKLKYNVYKKSLVKLYYVKQPTPLLPKT